MKTTTQKFIQIATTATLAGLCSISTAYGETELKFSSFVTSQNPIFACSITPVMNEIKEEAGDALAIEEYFGGGAFGASAAQFEQASRGITDMSFGVLTYNEGVFPLTELIGMPLAIRDHETATTFLNDVLLPKYLEKELGNVKVLNLWLTSPIQFHMRESLEQTTDLSGIRISASGQITSAALTKLGAQVASFPVANAYENLEKGVIDGTAGTWTTARAFRVGEVTDYHYNVDFGSSIGFTVMNRNTYDSLSPKIKAIFDKHAGTEWSEKVASCFTETDRKVITSLASDGDEIIEVRNSVRHEMRQKVEPVIQGHLSDLESRGLPAREVYQAILDSDAHSAER